VARRVRVTSWYARTAARVLRGGSSRSEAVGRTVHALAGASTLPGAADYEARGERVGRSWVRRVGGRNLWLWFRFSDEELMLLTVSTEPPVPIDD
jgi:hypothetical protein